MADDMHAAACRRLPRYAGHHDLEALDHVPSATMAPAHQGLMFAGRTVRIEAFMLK